MLCAAVMTYAQKRLLVPVPTSLFMVNAYPVNPAAATGNSRWQITPGSEFYTGAFRKINDVSLQILFNRKNTASPENYQQFGFLAKNFQEGEFIDRPRFYGSYRYRIALTKTSSLSAGIHAGLAGFSFASSNSSAGGSSYGPDANVGLWYARKNFGAGISARQLFETVLQPLNAEITLGRHYILHGYYDIPFSFDMKVRPGFLGLYNPSGSNQYHGALHLIYQDLVQLGIQHVPGEKFTYLAGLLNLAEEEPLTISIWLSYNVANEAAEGIRGNSFEFNLQMNID